MSDYLTYLTDRGRSAATVIRSAASIKSFYNYLVVSDAMKANPAKGIAAAKAERKCPQILTGREVELLLEQPKCVDEMPSSVSSSTLRFFTWLAETPARLKAICFARSVPI